VCCSLQCCIYGGAKVGAEGGAGTGPVLAGRAKVRAGKGSVAILMLRTTADVVLN